MNPVTWFSIPADDTEKATAFYNKAFGWDIQPLTTEDNSDFDYNVALNSQSDENFDPLERARVNGCIVKKATGITTPVVLVEVDDLDQAIAKVTAAGGTVESEKIPMKSLNGVFVLVKDPEGNMIEVFASN
ncbi:MAG TPA: VOC family protein [Verrucomicrobiae bacterium]|nr:VOC family protein [Verrucomicrobiae bacterium]